MKFSFPWVLIPHYFRKKEPELRSGAPWAFLSLEKSPPEAQRL